MARERMTITEHLDELRRRLIWSLLALTASIGGAFAYSRELFELVLAPVVGPIEQAGGTIAYLHITEGLMIQFQLALYAGVVIASPVLGYQILAFISPGLSRQEKRYIWIYLPLAAILFTFGVVLAYLFFLPLAVGFLVSFSAADVHTLISVSSLISFVTGFVLPFGLIFELPLVIALLTRLGLVTPQFLTRIRKYAILVIFIVAAVLTPPDVVSQIVMAVPLLGLFEISILVSRLIYRRMVRERERQRLWDDD